MAIQLRRGADAGRLVVPANHTSERDGFAAHAILSDDGGESWVTSSVIAPACNESQVVELADGRLMNNSRTQSFTNAERTGYRSVSFSTDGGENWTAPGPDPHLGDPQVQASLIRYSWPAGGSEGRLLFANPAPPVSRERGERIRMTVRLSRDDGKTWPAKRLIHQGPAAYSSLARLPDDSVGLLYEAGSDGPYEGIRLAASRSNGWREGPPEPPGSGCSSRNAGNANGPCSILGTAGSPGSLKEAWTWNQDGSSWAAADRRRCAGRRSRRARRLAADTEGGGQVRIGVVGGGFGTQSTGTSIRTARSPR